jgi:hypothetical protein
MIWTNQEKNKQSYSLSKWVSLFLFLLSIVLFVYVYYRSGSINSAIYFKYYLISIGGSLFWFVVFKLRKEFQQNILLSFFTLLIMLYLIEGILIFYRVGEPLDRAKTLMKLGFEYDQRTKLEVVKDLKMNDKNVVPSFHPTSLLNKVKLNKKNSNSPFPLGGVADKITVYSNESGEYIIYKSDRYGFNNPDSQWDSKTIEWLLVGDSFLHGSGAIAGQDIAAKILDLTSKSVINLGIGGNGPLIEYATLKEYGTNLKPKKVLWVYYEGNDLWDLENERKSAFLMQYMNDKFSQNLINRQTEVNNILNEYIDEKLRQGETEALMQDVINKSNWTRLYRIRKLLAFDEVGIADISITGPPFVEILNNAKTLVESWGGELYFVYLPEYSRYSKKIISHSQHKSKSDVIEMINTLKIPVIDIHQEVFSNKHNPLLLFPFALPGHYNADGYSEAAKAIVKSVNKYQ